MGPDRPEEDRAWVPGIPGPSLPLASLVAASSHGLLPLGAKENEQRGTSPLALGSSIPMQATEPACFPPETKLQPRVQARPGSYPSLCPVCLRAGPTQPKAWFLPLQSVVQLPPWPGSRLDPLSFNCPSSQCHPLLQHPPPQNPKPPQRNTCSWLEAWMR